jgi:hypothetical protein
MVYFLFGIPVKPPDFLEIILTIGGRQISGNIQYLFVGTQQ